eukprot:g38008.t1
MYVFEVGSTDVVDPFEIWTSKLQVKVTLKVDTEGNILHPASSFVIGGSRGYLMSMGQPTDDQQTSKGTWKLNVKLLTPEHIKEFKTDCTGWRTVKLLFRSPADRGEIVKGKIKWQERDRETCPNSRKACRTCRLYYKILYKVNANLVRSALGSVIHPDRTCAVSGRTTSENLTLTSSYDQFELASGAKLNQRKKKAIFFGSWANRYFIPFTVRTDYLKVLEYGQRVCKNLGRAYRQVFQSKELTPTEDGRQADSKVQEYLLRDTLKLGAAAAEALWGKTTVQ